VNTTLADVNLTGMNIFLGVFHAPLTYSCVETVISKINASRIIDALKVNAALTSMRLTLQNGEQLSKNYFDCLNVTLSQVFLSTKMIMILYNLFANAIVDFESMSFTHESLISSSLYRHSISLLMSYSKLLINSNIGQW